MATRKRIKLVRLAGIGVFVVFLSALWLNGSSFVAWYRFWRQFESIGANDEGYPEYRHRSSGIVFVHVPGGTFSMGSPVDEPGRRTHEGPQHPVALSSFLIAKYQVTQGQWEGVMGSNPSDQEGRNLPVVDVSWADCHEFCQRTGLSLPTEAQWEYACRAGTTTRYHSGNDESALATLGWFGENAGNRVHAVGEKPANAWGIHDMHGNVFEWCEDLYDPAFYSSEEATKKDPICATGRGKRVIRGGLYSEPGRICRSAWRSGYLPSDRSGDTGVRFAFRLER
ncbi:MAG: formylglycine-generating enzyme family protein [Planctomycetota bacterium]